MTIKSRVMDFVTGKGEARYTDIIKFIVEDIHGITYNKTLHRGYYSCAFSSYDAYFLHPFFSNIHLHQYCIFQLFQGCNDLRKSGKNQDTHYQYMHSI